MRNVTPVLLSERLEESPEVKCCGIMCRKTVIACRVLTHCFVLKVQIVLLALRLDNIEFILCFKSALIAAEHPG